MNFQNLIKISNILESAIMIADLAGCNNSIIHLLELTKLDNSLYLKLK